MNTSEDIQNQFTGQATYSPEDNKLRLYIGRVPREEYLALREEGWVALHKQREAGGGDFAATWTPQRRDTALRYAGTIDDEDMGPEERAADRAERFMAYQEKRLDEATGHADRYDAGPSVHGFQSYARAVKSADRHDRMAGRAVDAWEKAEYWQRRTAGVIAHRLYLSSPAVRMGRIKTLESELRKYEASLVNQRKVWAAYCKLRDLPDGEEKTAAVLRFVGSLSGLSTYLHPRAAGLANPYMRENPVSLYSLMTCEADPITGAEALALWFSDHSEPGAGPWFRHYEMRLAYERQMLEAQGGRAAFVEMEVGGFIGNHQIQKVNKSTATGRVVSVNILAPTGANYDRKGKPYGEGNPRPLTIHTINVERMAADAYRAPTDEERAAFLKARKEEKAARPKVATIPLINPTDEDAERLQEAWNERAKDEHCASHLRRYGKDYAEDFKPSTVCRITQAAYSANSKGAYARAETRGLCRDMKLEPRQSNMYSSHEEAEKKRRGPKVCDIRTTGSDGSDYGARRVIVLTDKPQKSLPVAVWQKVEAAELVTA